MEISTLLIFALIAVIVIVTLHGKYQEKEFDRQIKGMEFKIQQDNANFQRWARQKGMEFDAYKWSVERNDRMIYDTRNHELAIKRYELDLNIARSNHQARILELENQKIINMVNFALNQNRYDRDMILSKINLETQKYMRDIEVLSHLGSKEAETRKSKLLYDLDKGLDDITKDLNSPWG